MFLIKNNRELHVFSDNEDWTDNIGEFREYEDRENALADILKYKLPDSSVVSIKDWVRDLFTSGRITIA